jgi:hypothetical protein
MASILFRDERTPDTRRRRAFHQPVLGWTGGQVATP